MYAVRQRPCRIYFGSLAAWQLGSLAAWQLGSLAAWQLGSPAATNQQALQALIALIALIALLTTRAPCPAQPPTPSSMTIIQGPLNVDVDVLLDVLMAVPSDGPLIVPTSPLFTDPLDMFVNAFAPASAPKTPMRTQKPQQIPNFIGMQSASKYWFLPMESKLEAIGDYVTHLDAHALLGVVDGGQAARTAWMRPCTLSPTPPSDIPRIRYIYNMDTFQTGQENVNAALLTRTMFDAPVIMEFEDI